MKKISKFSYLTALALGLSTTVIGNSAMVFAQNNDSGYAPRGIRLNSFYVFPVVEFGISHDDNIFRLPNDNARTTGAFVDGPVSDNILTTVGSVTVNSDWSRHALDAKALIDLGTFDEFSGEDYSNYDFGVSGQLDVKRGSYISGKTGFRKRDEDRNSVEDREVDPGASAEDIFGVEPTAFSAQYVGVGFKYNPARLGVVLDLDYKTLDYEDVINAFGGNVDNDDRDRSRVDARLRVGYEILPKRNLYIEGNFDSVDYDQQFDSSGIERSSSGVKTAIGMNFELSNLLLGDVYVGHVERDYDSSTQLDISSNSAGVDLRWFPTRLTSINLGLSQLIEESTEATVSGYLSTATSLGIKHELKRNIILSLGFDYTKNEFTQNAPNQKELEEITGYDLGGTYLISRLLSTSLNFRHEFRDSDIEIQEYENDRITFTVRVHW